ncbi:hypothetical protein Dvina_14625 [Dactylosporangium vinaceum]|uniref:Uncharacterized protein n=1 Tax=Dactylosporangium vinaceum TaxID=53362 RepID=A0ABV5M1G0_9ACTN|nr:hypothetical protein [Dactylosporangium vinaceum]UAB99197.1 hypothetical protein Dvina_14625 [Dactylosporangium vinaceum]
MPPALVRPYVRVIPIAHIKPAAPRRSAVAPRPAPPVYRPRHEGTAAVGHRRSAGHRRPAARRRGPALVWGALLVALATSVITLRPTAAQTVAGTTGSDAGRLQTALVPAQVIQPAPAPRRPDAPPPRRR